jgi:hypothetical protein
LRQHLAAILTAVMSLSGDLKGLRKDWNAIIKHLAGLSGDLMNRLGHVMNIPAPVAGSHTH